MIKRPRWTTVLALLLVPLLVAGGFLWGTWGANPRLRNVQAAIVNNDEMVTINGQAMPLGRQLASYLVDTDRDQNLTWVLADSNHAAAGLADGSYAAVVTIPKNFSAAATSFSGSADKAVQATIQVQTSPATGVAETALGQHIADGAANSLNRFLTGEYLKNIYVGFNTMSDQFLELKDGTAKLSDGAAQLSDGLKLASDGGVQLSSGAHQLLSGSNQLTSGTDTFTSGVATFDTGVGQYVGGVKQYIGGITPMMTQVRGLVTQVPDWGDLVTTLDPIMTNLPATATQLNTQIQTLLPGLKSTLTTLDGFVTQTGDVQTALAAYASQLASQTVPCPAQLQAAPGACDAFNAGVMAGQASAIGGFTAIAQQLQVLGSDADTLHAQITTLLATADALAAAAEQLVQIAPAAAAQWATLKAQLPNGTLTRAEVLALLNQVISGGDQLIAGGDQLVAGSAQLTSGASQLASGSHTFTTGLGTFVSGVDQYTGGVTQAATGAKELAEGTTQLADGVASGAGKVPTYNEAQRTQLSKVVASPVDTTDLQDLPLPTISWASLLLVMALWLGALAVFAAYRPVDPANLTSSASNVQLLWRGMRPGLLIVGVQAVLLAGLSAAVAGLGWGTGLGLALGALLIAGTFVACNQALAAWFGTRGRVVSLALLLVTVISALAYSAPPAFDALKMLSPLTPALSATRAIMTGQSPTLSLLGVAAWGLLGLGAVWAATIRSRTVNLSAVSA